MSESISFKNWKEASEYILKNTERNCLNCKYGNKGEITNSPYIFCTEPNNGMRMADLRFGIVCADHEKYEKEMI